MSEMNEVSELYEESNDLQMDVMPSESHLPHIKVGGGSPELSQNPSRAAGAQPQLEEEGPMEEEAAQPMEQPGQIAGPEFERESKGEEEPLSAEGYRVSAALDEATRMFLRTSRAREAMHSEKALLDQLAFIREFSLMVVSRLTEELGCDEIIDRE
ncbi:hypothetical protein K5549_015713 [Capra hircus]|nr:hypothetical protein K5549_015713 [Capra hircus]